jgi:serine/threonine protein kinase
MELVEGHALSDRIRSGVVPVDEALPIARQIADALEDAHERGIIHRDLKPSNVKITREGAVKVLDFGLAKALEEGTSEEELQNSPTLTVAATRAGILLGTAAYMSPEQTRGKRVDRRADIWAFGCVLYEMLTGQCAFAGETTSDTLAAVIRAEPDWSSVAANTPMRVRELLRRCLQKDPRQRLRDIGDARIAIEEVLVGSPGENSALPGGAGRTAAPSRRA